MPTYKADLSVSSLDELLRSVNAYKTKLEAAPVKIVSELAEIGRNEIQANINGITDKDGNRLATAGEFTFGDTGFAYMEGEQGQFLEYGTGVQGQSSPHPQASKAGWNYNSGKTIHAKGRWAYWDPVRHQHIWTNGIPAQMPVLRAALTMRRRLREVAKGALK